MAVHQSRERKLYRDVLCNSRLYYRVIVTLGTLTPWASLPVLLVLSLVSLSATVI